WVRFRHPRLVAETVATALQQALRRPAVVPGVPVEGWGVQASATGPASVVAEQAALFGDAAEADARPLFGRVLGQVQDTFVVSASDEEVFFLDQHVAHERVIFERLRRELDAGKPAAQALLFPESLDLGPGARAVLERWRAPLEQLGFAFEEFGGGAIVVSAVPALLKGDEPRRLIEAAVDEFAGPVWNGARRTSRAAAAEARRRAPRGESGTGRVVRAERRPRRLGGERVGRVHWGRWADT